MVFTPSAATSSRPALVEERRRNLEDPIESEASDVDADTLLDHAPNWANGEDADRRDGLRVSKKSDKKQKTPPLSDVNEECKLVLVVRTDLGMTKGMLAPHLRSVSTFLELC